MKNHGLLETGFQRLEIRASALRPLGHLNKRLNTLDRLHGRFAEHELARGTRLRVTLFGFAHRNGVIRPRTHPRGPRRVKKAAARRLARVVNIRFEGEPRNITVIPETFEPENLENFSNRTSFWRSFTISTA